MSSPEGHGRVEVRGAALRDVPGVCAFGEAYVAPHYAPLIGAEPADDQVRLWWNVTTIEAAVSEGVLVLAEADGHVVGVGQRGRRGADHVVYKLYVRPDLRGAGLGPRLLDALVAQLPADAERLCIEHFAANERAGTFYEREGYTVERVEPGPGGEAARAVVWRARRLERRH